MPDASKVAVIGSRETVLAFRALGIEAVAVASDDEARAALHSLAKQGCAVILVAEDTHARIGDAVARYKATPLPAIIPIPSAGEAGGR